MGDGGTRAMPVRWTIGSGSSYRTPTPSPLGRDPYLILVRYDSIKSLDPFSAGFGFFVPLSSTVIPNRRKFSLGRNLDTARREYSDHEITRILFVLK